MPSRFDHLPHRRAIIVRRTIANALAALEGSDTATLRRAATAQLKAALDAGRAEIARRRIEHPSRGLEAAAGQAFLIDQILRLLFDFTTQRLHRNSNRTAAERLTLLAVGGYGRGEMAPHSGVDIAFLAPWKQTGRAVQAGTTRAFIAEKLDERNARHLKMGDSRYVVEPNVKEGKGGLRDLHTLFWIGKDAYN